MSWRWRSNTSLAAGWRCAAADRPVQGSRQSLLGRRGCEAGRIFLLDIAVVRSKKGGGVVDSAPWIGEYLKELKPEQCSRVHRVQTLTTLGNSSSDLPGGRGIWPADCSTWGGMADTVHGRSPENDYEGVTPKARAANMGSSSCRICLPTEGKPRRYTSRLPAPARCSSTRHQGLRARAEEGPARLTFIDQCHFRGPEARPSSWLQTACAHGRRRPHAPCAAWLLRLRLLCCSARRRLLGTHSRRACPGRR